jgi:hypothetical protein
MSPNSCCRVSVLASGGRPPMKRVCMAALIAYTEHSRAI